MASKQPKNMFIIGAPCTGKTTLLNALKDHLEQTALSAPGSREPRYISEVARTVMKQLHLDRNDIVMSSERSLRLQRAILDAQYQAELPTANGSTDWYISDRSGIDPIVYALLYVSEQGTDELLASNILQALAQKMREGLVFICEAGCSWLADDGVRLMPGSEEDWSRFDFAFQCLLKENEIDYHLISKDTNSLEARVDQILRALEQHALRDTTRLPRCLPRA